MTQQPRPVYLLAGGPGSRRPGPDPLLQAVFRGFGIPKPAVAYSGTASGDSRMFFGFISGSFKAAGAGKVEHARVLGRGADIGKARKMMEDADIIFISGGDVEAGMDALKEKNMVGFLDDLYRQGKPFFGISAGAIMLAARWVRWRDPDDDASAELFPCLGYAPVICDTHDEAAGWEELQAALKLEKNGAAGYGLASNSGIMVTPDGMVTGIGGTVYRYARRGGEVIRLDNLKTQG